MTTSLKISLFWVTLCGLFFNFIAVSGQNGDACTTPNSVPGSCVAVTQCPALLAILQNRQRTQAQTKFLRDSQCGYGAAGSGLLGGLVGGLLSSNNRSPNVCCASGGCTTADNTPGNCVSLDDCPRLKQLFNGPKPLPTATVTYLRRSTCQGPARYNVCCGSQGSGSQGGGIQGGGGGQTVATTTTTSTTQSSGLSSMDVDSLLPAPDKCGIESNEDRIVGGNITNLDQYPWMGLVEYRTKRNTISLGCGAALISTRYVITAGHCVYGDVLTQLGTPINIRLGEYDKRTLVDCVKVVGGQDCNEEPVTIAIEKIIPHPEYKPESGSQKNDIALFRLASDAPYTDYIRPICLPAVDISTQVNVDDLIVSGWGATETGRSSDVKLHLAIPLVPLAECQRAYSNPRLRAELWDKQLCAGGVTGKDSCRGDSGGPLMGATEVQWSLHGVVSFGPTPCALPNVPGVYTKVFSYVSWIRQQIRP